MNKKYYYFDNSTTSFPKPKEVAEYMSDFILNSGGTYGRVNTERGLDTTRKIEECRELLANIIGTKKDNHIVFTSGATRSINDILIGLNLNNKKVLISTLEHNAVIRPIHHLSKTINLEYKVLEHLDNGLIDLESLKNYINNFKPYLVIVNMESNISGVIQDIKKIKDIIGDTLLLVDATQAIGVHNIYVDEWDIDFIAFTCHKGLLGPTGVGGYFIKNPSILKPAYFGGGFGDGVETPYSIPEIYESGTPNTVGIIGLLAALKHKPTWNITIYDLISIIKKIESLNKYKVLWSKDISTQGFVFSIVPFDNSIDMSDLVNKLYDKYHIECRYGYHCSFLSHKFYNNSKGAIRFSFSPYTTNEDLEYLYLALKEVIVL